MPIPLPSIPAVRLPSTQSGQQQQHHRYNDDDNNEDNDYNNNNPTNDSALCQVMEMRHQS